MIELLNTPEQTLDVGQHKFGPFPLPPGHNAFACHMRQINWPIVRDPYLVRLYLHISHDGEDTRPSWAEFNGEIVIDEDTGKPMDEMHLMINIGCVGTGNPDRPGERIMRLTNDKAYMHVEMDVKAPIRTAIRVWADQHMVPESQDQIVNIPDWLK